MSSVCSNTSSKTWTPLPDRFIDEHLVEMFPLFDQAQLQLVDVTNPAAVHTLLQLPPNLIVYRVKVRTVSWLQSWTDKVCCHSRLCLDRQRTSLTPQTADGNRHQNVERVLRRRPLGICFFLIPDAAYTLSF